MKSAVLALCTALFVPVALLSSGSAWAGDPQAHTAAIVKAANAVLKEAQFKNGIGAPEFTVPMPPDVPPDTGESDSEASNVCFVCAIDDPACAERCDLGSWINEPDHWQCTGPGLPPRLSTLNQQGSLLQASAATAWSGDNAAMACNYTHFAKNSIIWGLSAADAEDITQKWAKELLTKIVDENGNGSVVCNRATFKEYLARSVKALHFKQDAQSEHHATGNEVCRTQDLVSQLAPSDDLIDVEADKRCRDWLDKTMKAVDDADLCDDAWSSAPTTRLRLLCSGGATLACAGLERLLRHHCNVESQKTIACGGPPNDHQKILNHRTGKPLTYCEGERFSGGGEDFLNKAASESSAPLEAALKAWADVCGRPDPCTQPECSRGCTRKSDTLSGYCALPPAAKDCKLACVCEEQCGKEGQPCCAVEDSKCFGDTECSAGTGRCVKKGSHNACDASDSGSSGGANAGGASGMGEGGNGSGEGGAAGDDGAGGAPNGGSGGTGGTSQGPPHPSYEAIDWGDPHLRTFDGLKYDLQAVGELTVVKDPTDGMEIQVRTKPYGASKLVAVVVAVAARVGNDRVAFYVDGTSTLNGDAKTFSPSGTKLPDGGTVYEVSGGRVVVWPDGTQLSALYPVGWFSLQLHLSSARAGKVVGELGEFDGSLENELLSRDGDVLPLPADFETFYGVFAESWRIEQADSLFDYGPDENTETFTDRSFPHWLLRTQDLDADLAESAALTCEAAGVDDPYLLDACTLDVAATGDDAFADGYAGLPAPKGALEILPPRVTGGTNGGGLGKGGPPRSGTLGVGDQDFFSFAAKAGEGIQLRAVNVAAGPFVPVLQVYDPSGTLVSSNSSNDVAYASFNAAKNGTYTVVVSDYSGKNAADYNLYFFKGPGSNELGALSPGTEVSETIDKGDLDSYTFTANAGEGIQLRVTDVAGGAFVPALVVYDPTGAIVSSNYTNDVAYASFNAGKTGTYTVLVHDWSTGAVSTGAYNLYYFKGPGANELGALTPGGEVSETIDKGDLDSYTFTANAGEGIQLRVTDVAGGAFVPALVVYDPTGAIVSSNYTNDVAYASFNAGKTGTYTVLVHDWSTGAAATGDYNLYFFKGPGSNELGALTPGGEVSGTIDEGDLDSYTFTANAGEGIQLRVTDVAGGAFVPALVVYDPTGAIVSSNFTNDVAYASFNAGKTGTYTVLVHDWSTGAAATGDYNLYFFKAPGTTEYGALVSGGVASGSIEKGDLDSYFFTAAAGESVQLRLVDLGASSFVPALVVYDGAGKVVSTNYSNDVAYASFTIAASGTYNVLVYDWSTGALSTGDYDLYFAKAPGTTDGGALTQGSAVTGTIDEGDLDSYTLATTAGTAVHLTLTDVNASSFAPALAVYNPAGGLVGSNYAADTASVNFTAPSTGTYTVFAYDWSAGAVGGGPYSLLWQ